MTTDMTAPSTDPGRRSAKAVAVDVLGPIEVRCHGELAPPLGKLPLRVLAVLAASSPAPLPTEVLIERVWPGGAPATAASALRTHLTRVRAVVGDALEHTTRGYCLDPSVLDVTTYDRLVGEAGASPDRRLEALAAAIGLWRGDPFDPFATDEVLAAEVGALRERHRLVEDEWMALTARAGATRDLDVMWRMARDEPLREPRWRSLMQALVATGRPAEALAAFAEVKQSLAEQLGLPPGPELHALSDAIVVDDTLEGQPPRWPTPFVGREGELATLEAMISESRLVTVTGAGGVGKSRLAAAVIVGEAQRGRVVRWFHVPSPDLASRVGRELLSQIGTSAASEADALDLLVTRLAGVEVVVIDGAEAALDEVVAIVMAVTARRPLLRVVVSSRVPLGAPGEAVLRLGPLPVPSGVDDLDGPAAELLVRLRSDASGADLEAVEIVSMCRRTGGLPAAIELAARGPGLDAVSEADGPMVDTVAATVESLEPIHRRVAEAMACLPAGASMHLLRHLVEGGPRVDRAAHYLDLAGLTQVERVGGELRRDMIDPIRDALRHLSEPGTGAEVWERAVGYLIAQGRRTRPSFAEAPDGDELRRLGIDQPLLLAALDRKEAHRLELVEAASYYLGLRGFAGSADSWLEPWLESPDPLLRARATVTAAHIGRFSGAIVPLADRLESAVATFIAEGDDVSAISGAAFLTLARCYSADLVGAQEAVASFAPLLGDATPIQQATADVSIGFVSLLSFDWPAAIEHLTAAERIFGELSPASVGMSLYLRAILSVVREGESQESLLEGAIECAELIDDRPLLGLCRYSAIGISSVGEPLGRHLAAIDALDAAGMSEWAAQARMGAAALLIGGDHPEVAGELIIAAMGPLERAGAGGQAYVLGGLAAALRNVEPELASELAWWARSPVDPSFGPLTPELLRKRDEWLALIDSAPTARPVDELLAAVSFALQDSVRRA